METVAAFVVEAVTVVVVVEVGGGPTIGDMDDVGATLPPQG